MKTTIRFRVKPADVERFMRYVIPEPNSGCWLWYGAMALESGYGRFGVDGHTVQAHRFAIEAFIGPIADGQEPDHLCRLTSCVNPRHLERVTPAENLARRDAANEPTACPYGHPYTPENRVKGSPRLRCRVCQRKRNAAWMRKKRASVVTAVVTSSENLQ